MSKENKVDMSAEAVTARLRRACGLGDAERLTSVIRSARAEIESARPAVGKKPKPRKKK